MKFAVVFAAAAIATVSAASNEVCIPKVAGETFAKLAPILGNPALEGCATDSTYSMLQATALPTEAQTIKMCGSQNCIKLISTVAALNPPDCKIAIPTSPTQFQMNIFGLVSSFDSDCKRLVPVATPAPAKPSSAPVTPTSAPGASSAPTTAPSPGTPSASTPAPTKVAC
ncbi:hypothetical protein PybrP1_002983 [[Pythium] brassicae (nom. inval.)]|nr:hypothetical protein PybrP1_002983 [[Pythium] brassicae (nom. inval.)]